MSDADIGLRERLKAEASLLDLVRGDAGDDVILHLQCIRGRWNVEVLRWLSERRQRIGRGDSFVEAWRSAFPADQGGAK